MNRMRPRRLSVFEQNLYRLDNRCTELVHGIIAERKKVEELEATIEEAKRRCNVITRESPNRLDNIIWIREALEKDQ